MNLVKDKFSPPRRVCPASRPRLLRTLQANLTWYAATALSGRAGTGKTWLAAEFAQTCQWHTAWYQVGVSDSNLSVFLKYLAVSVQQVQPVATTAWDWLRDTATVTEQAEVVAHALAEHSIQPLLLVLDDLHLIYDADWFSEFFGRLLSVLPGSVHLLMVGRGLPPAPLWRLRSKQRLGTIEEAALAFTVDEIQVLLADEEADSAGALAIYRQTHGRASRVIDLARQENRLPLVEKPAPAYLVAAQAEHLLVGCE